MKTILMVLLLGVSLPVFAAKPTAKTFYDFQVNTLGGKRVKLSDYKGKAVLVVNTASKCGLTPQYAGLQKLYDRYHAQGLEVLGFPSNDFMQQEPGTAKEIQDFCDLKYHVKFPLMEKNPVTGKLRQPLYDWLVTNSPADAGKEVSWNFEKFLISKEGKIIGRFAPKVTPESPEVIGAIEKAVQ